MTEQGSAVTREEEPRRRPRSMWVRMISGTVVFLLVAVAAIFAFRADGTPVHDVSLADGNIWVSSGATGYWGRVNTGSHSLDVVHSGAKADSPRDRKGQRTRPDIVQDGHNVIAISETEELLALDTRTGEAVGGPVQAPPLTVPFGTRFLPPDTVALGGETVAVVDHSSGNIWAKRLDAEGGTSLEGLMDSPVYNQLGEAAAVTVSLDGDIMAVSAESGTVVEIPTEGDGFGSPERTDLPFDGSRMADITAVGDRWVVLDLEEGLVHAEDVEDPQSLPEGGEGTPGEKLVLALLQQPGPESDVAAVQTVSHAAYVQIDEDVSQSGDHGVISELDEDDERVDFINFDRPVMNGDCLYAAWGNGPEVVWGSACGEEQRSSSTLGHQSNTIRRNGVAVRQNAGKVVLNDLDNGRVFDLSLEGDPRIDTWPEGAERRQAPSYTPRYQREESSSPTNAPAGSPRPTSTSTTQPTPTSG